MSHAKGSPGLSNVKAKSSCRVGAYPYMAQMQALPPDNRPGDAESTTVVCKDCKTPSPLDALIDVDALHVQCPSCLYVFFLERSARAGT
jgi:hypothetical protein